MKQRRWWLEDVAKGVYARPGQSWLAQAGRRKEGPRVVEPRWNVELRPESSATTECDPVKTCA
jgi:hypothetical protein